MRRSAFAKGWGLAMWFCISLAFPGLAWNSEMAGENAYGFVHYGGDSLLGGLTSYIDQKVKYVGAGWIQAEGPQTSPGGSASVAWTKVAPTYLPDPKTGQCGSPPTGPANFSTIDAWVSKAAGRGMGVVMAINTSHQGGYGSCWVRACKNGNRNCAPRDWNQWYRFVYEVARHFDGTRGPRVRYFTSVEEADQFYDGDTADLLGGNEVEIDRSPAGAPPVHIPAGIVPVAHRAVEDAGTGARFVLGAVTGSAAQPALVHLYEEWQTGTDRDTLNRIARSYNINLAGQPADLWTYFGTVQLARDRKLVRPSFAAADHYDIYSIHLYDSYYGFLYDLFPFNDRHPYVSYQGPEGFQQVLFWIAEQIPGKELWITGTGLAPNPYKYAGRSVEEQEAYLASHVVKTLAIAHAAGVEWVTWSGIYDNPLWDGLWDGLAPGVTPRKRSAAETFRLMSRILPTKNAVTSRGMFEYRSRWGWEVVAPGETDPWSAEALLYRFEVTRPDAATGHVAAGWCVDQTPDRPEDFTPPGGAGCPKLADVRGHFEIARSSAVAVYGADGALRACSPAGAGGVLTVAFESSPFVIAWGQDIDLDCQPDISDPLNTR